MASCLVPCSPAAAVCCTQRMLYGTLGLTGGYWFLMGHCFGELGREPLHCLSLQPMRVPPQLQQRCSPEPSWRIIHAQVVAVSLLHAVKETSGPEARGWCCWHFCLLDGFLRAFRAAKETKSSQQQQAMWTFESRTFVGGCVCRWKALLSLSLGCFRTRWELFSWGPISGWASSVTWCE